MVFSGVIPVSGAPADPRTHRLWKLAESHGATVESGIGRHTTHVVAVRLGTAKVRKFVEKSWRRIRDVLARCVCDNWFWRKVRAVLHVLRINVYPVRSCYLILCWSNIMGVC